MGAAMTCRVQVPLSVISAKVKLADLCKSMLSEYTSVDKARRGSPEKKSVSARWRQSVCRRAAYMGSGEVHFQGSPADRRQLHARYQPAQGRRCCPWSVLCRFVLAVLDDGMWSGEMHTAAAGAAELGEKAHDADAVCLSGFEGLGSLPVGVWRGGDGSDDNRGPEGNADGQLERRAATCDGLSRGDECGGERTDEVLPPVLAGALVQLSGSDSTTLVPWPAC